MIKTDEFREKDFQRHITKTALNGITQKVPQIHYIGLSTDIPVSYIYEHLGKYKVDQNYQSQRRKKYQNYGAKAFLQLKNGKLSIFSKPIHTESDYPKCMLSTTGTCMEHLIEIQQALSGHFMDVETSYVEYAIDFFCRDSASVADLFYLLRRYMFFPNTKITSMFGSEYNGWREPRETNTGFMVKGKKNSKYIKIYERGNDNKKQKKSGGVYWWHKDVDRVRLEVTLKKTILKKKGIYTLTDLLEYPRFQRAFFPNTGRKNELIQFKNFKDKANSLPKDWQDYMGQIDDEDIECFQVEYFKVKAEAKAKAELEAKEKGYDEPKVKNISQQIEHNEKFIKFKEDIRMILANFDEKWMKKYESYIQG